jgi:uncharacterized protein YndB with AHSA1/START domain
MPEATDRLLHLERQLPVPPATVFSAMTDPDQLAKWWGPAGFAVPELELDLRAGGSYRITMQPPDAEVFHLQGEFTAVEPPERLAYTFRWEEPDPDDVETEVVISLRDAEGGTELILDQGVFATDARLKLHHDGWTEGLERLARLLQEA